jgi:hypothetical protein
VCTHPGPLSRTTLIGCARSHHLSHYLSPVFSFHFVSMYSPTQQRIILSRRKKAIQLDQRGKDVVSILAQSTPKFLKDIDDVEEMYGFNSSGVEEYSIYGHTMGDAISSRNNIAPGRATILIKTRQVFTRSASGMQNRLAVRDAILRLSPDEDSIMMPSAQGDVGLNVLLAASRLTRVLKLTLSSEMERGEGGDSDHSIGSDGEGENNNSGNNSRSDPISSSKWGKVVGVARTLSLFRGKYGTAGADTEGGEGGKDGCGEELMAPLDRSNDPSQDLADLSKEKSKAVRQKRMKVIIPKELARSAAAAGGMSHRPRNLSPPIHTGPNERPDIDHYYRYLLLSIMDMFYRVKDR